MNHLLKSIVDQKKVELEASKKKCPAALLEKQLQNCKPVRSLSAAVKSGSGVIAEYKRKSPSGGIFSSVSDPASQAFAYEQNGACAVSVLTDFSFFGGGLFDLETIKQAVSVPVLRKEFILDEYQVLESRVFGADAILLIASCLQPERAYQLCECAHSYGLEVLLEVHTRDEIELFSGLNADCFGINNRNLDTLSVSLTTSLQLHSYLPKGKPAISESGIRSKQDVDLLRVNGFQGFLIGDIFLRDGGLNVLEELTKKREVLC